MPWIIDYSRVLEQMRQQHCRCLYYNSGAFGFDTTLKAQTAGWIGPEDPTITPEARALTYSFADPYEHNLTQAAMDLWRTHLPGRLWIMPMSHWAYELDFGSAQWLPQALEQAGLDPGLLVGRNNGAAIEFGLHEAEAAGSLLHRLLQQLQNSDFMMAFPNHPLLCMVHHHKQLWWSTTDETLLDVLRRIPADLQLASGSASQSSL